MWLWCNVFTVMRTGWAGPTPRLPVPRRRTSAGAMMGDVFTQALPGRYRSGRLRDPAVQPWQFAGGLPCRLLWLPSMATRKLGSPKDFRLGHPHAHVVELFLRVRRPMRAHHLRIQPALSPSLADTRATRRTSVSHVDLAIGSGCVHQGWCMSRA